MSPFEGKMETGVAGREGQNTLSQKVEVWKVEERERKRPHRRRRPLGEKKGDDASTHR